MTSNFIQFHNPREISLRWDSSDSVSNSSPGSDPKQRRGADLEEGGPTKRSFFSKFCMMKLFFVPPTLDAVQISNLHFVSKANVMSWKLSFFLECSVLFPTIMACSIEVEEWAVKFGYPGF